MSESLDEVCKYCGKVLPTEVEQKNHFAHPCWQLWLVIQAGKFFQKREEKSK